MDNIQELKLLVQSRYPIIYVTTYEENRLEQILDAVAGELRLSFFHWSSTEGIKRWGMNDAIVGTKDPLQALAFVCQCERDAMFLFRDFHSQLENPLIVRKLRDVAGLRTPGARTIVLSAPHLVLPDELVKTIVHYEIQLPSAEELKQLVQEALHGFSKSRFALERIWAGQSIAVDLAGEEFEKFVQSLRGFTMEEAERAIADAVIRDLTLDHKDIEMVLARKKEVLKRDNILELFSHTETFAVVGGMDNLKAWLTKRKNAFSKEAEQFGLPAPKGLLLLGVQGCGKSLCAKAVAKEWQMPLVRLDPSRLYGKFIGESEKSLLRAIDMAKYLAPVILWVDEIEKGFSFTTSSEADAGLSRRIFGTFVTWLQEKTEPVFVVATCNQVEDLPPEFLRKGRFDEIFFVDLPTHEERKNIFAIHLTKRKKDPAQFHLEVLASASKLFSGAEIEQAIVSALYAAFSGSGTMTTELILEEIRNTVPLAVTMSEKIQELREWAKSRTVPASKAQ